MFFGDNVQDTRQLFYTSWRKHRSKQILIPLEQQLVDVIIFHPEYHSIFEKEDAFLDKDFLPEMGHSNPFLHMGLHLAVREQIATDRPPGVASLFQKAIKKYSDSHHAEHMLMECLAECLWQAQRNRREPDELHYINSIRDLT